LPFGRSRLGHVTVLNQEHVLRHVSSFGLLVES
jgi:hypothetical protein